MFEDAMPKNKVSQVDHLLFGNLHISTSNIFGVWGAKLPTRVYWGSSLFMKEWAN